MHDIVFSAAAGLSFPVAIVGVCGPGSLILDDEARSCSLAPDSGEPGPDPDPDPDINGRDNM